MLKALAIAVLAMMLAVSLHGEAFSSDVRVYISGGIVIGGISIFIAFATGGSRSARGPGDENSPQAECAGNFQKGCAMVYRAEDFPVTPDGMLTLLKW
jgi:hypothetical protein